MLFILTWLLSVTPVLFAENRINNEELTEPKIGIEPLPKAVLQVLKGHKIKPESMSIILQPVTLEKNSEAAKADQPVINHNPLTLRSPASIVKLLTSYAALELLGPTYRWKTRFYIEQPTVQESLTEPLMNGTLNGHLRIVGAGDPFLRMQDIWMMLSQLRQKGIKRIEGDLLLDSRLFAPINEDLAAFDRQPARTYNVIPSALLANFQTVQFTFNPSKTSAAKVALDMSPNLSNVKVVNRLKVKKGKCKGYNAGISIKVHGKGRNLVELDGSFPSQCKDYKLYRTVLETESYFFGVFKTIWQQLGGEFVGGFQKVSADKLGADTTKSELFLTWHSAPLYQVIQSGNKFSNNTLTRNVLLTLASKYEQPIEKKQQFSQSQALSVLRDFANSRNFATEGLIVEKGSGLSRTTRLSAQLISDVLLDAYQSPNFAEFVSSLPISGKDGTLKDRMLDSSLIGTARLKTGRLDHVISLAGYIQAKSGKRYTLVAIINQQGVHRGKGVNVVDWLAEWVHQNY